MPQPFNSVFRAPVSTGGLYHNGRPVNDGVLNLIMQRAKCLDWWQGAESGQMSLFVAFAGGPEDRMVKLFFALEVKSAKTVALNQIAAERFSGRDLLIFRAVMKLYAQLESERNKLVHWSWSSIPSRPDLLAATNPKDIARKSIRSIGVAQQERSQWFRSLQDRTFVYSEADFTDLADRFGSLAATLGLLETWVQTTNENEQRFLCEAILKSPGIGETVRHLEKRAQTPQAK